MTESQTTWYIVKIESGQCQIIPGSQIAGSQIGAVQQPPNTQQWGPFASYGEAIARRVGLIRAGKCKPT